MTYGSIADALKAVSAKPKPEKPFPASGPNGEPHIFEKLGPDTKVPAGQRRPLPAWERTLDYFYGKTCMIKGCKEGAQFTTGGGEVPLVNALTGDPIMVNIDAIAQGKRIGHQVPMVPEVLLCLQHHGEYVRAQEERAIARQKALVPESWPLHELNPDGAEIEIKGQKVLITEAPEHGGRKITYELNRYAEVEAWRDKKRFVPDVLTHEQVRDLKAKTRIAEGMKPDAAKAISQLEYERLDAAKAKQETISEKARVADKAFNLANGTSN